MFIIVLIQMKSPILVTSVKESFLKNIT
ncbi:unnamed protein product [Larinioides sclopetarius]|uniref:Uncharacterized protein n=1 Tax=Larinioides sclopetarius TaxID=280406 RepID=A0AAV2ABF7_9ARAC